MVQIKETPGDLPGLWYMADALVKSHTELGGLPSFLVHVKKLTVEGRNSDLSWGIARTQTVPQPFGHPERHAPLEGMGLESCSHFSLWGTISLWAMKLVSLFSKDGMDQDN